MQHLKVSYKNPQQHLLNFEFIVDAITTPTIELQLSAWRPGRYELQNFAKNIQYFGVFSSDGTPLKFSKITKDRWLIKTQNESQNTENIIDKVIVKYNYYAVQMDAGGTFLDENLCYINWITCVMYVEGRQNEPYQIDLQLPNNYIVACGMKHHKNNHKQKHEQSTLTLFAENFYKLTAAPMIASPTLQEYCYQIPNLDTNFHIWIHGKWKPNETQILSDFQTFTQTQVQIFAANQDFDTSNINDLDYCEMSHQQVQNDKIQNDKKLTAAFPETDYHFLFLITPFAYHHGVEHYNSTVLVMGVNPEQNFQNEMYEDVLGIASHELFHFWNICRIRPIELLPYDYTQENYFQTGFVAEGITTYYGDYLLSRSHVWSFEKYSIEINNLLRRHFENFGRHVYSVAESSWDLWLDGYVAGIPNRKVSIYNEGALAALILDIEIRKLTENNKSLDDVMQTLWTDFALQNKGYSLEDYQNIVNKIAGKDMKLYFDDCIFGHGKLENWLSTAFNYIGCELQINKNSHLEEQLFGFRVASKSSRIFVSVIAPNSPADMVLSLQDELISIDNQPVEFNLLKLLKDKTTFVLQILRNQKLKTVVLNTNDKTYFDKYTIIKMTNLTSMQENNFKLWLCQ